MNVCRKPGEWQTYDIVFEAPRFDPQGKLTRPAFVTVLQNGVLVQNHFQIQGTTAWDVPPKYTAHAAKLPVILQYHGNPVRFRNVWIRELPPRPAARQGIAEAVAALMKSGTECTPLAPARGIVTPGSPSRGA